LEKEQLHSDMVTSYPFKTRKEIHRRTTTLELDSLKIMLSKEKDIAFPMIIKKGLSMKLRLEKHQDPESTTIRQTNMILED
jgi:hypothetical protein